MVGKGCRKGLGRRPILSRAELLFGPRSPQGCNCGREMVENGSRTGACRGAILPRAQLLRGLRRAQESGPRSEEHTSELQSLRHLVCRLLLGKRLNSSHLGISYAVFCLEHVSTQVTSAS